MDIMDLASAAIKKVTANYGKKIAKTTPCPVIPDALPVEIKGKVWRAGFSRDEIMPDLDSGKTYWIAGHGSGHKMDGVISPVYIHALWLDCGTKEGILWLSADIIGLTNIEVNKIRERIKSNKELAECRHIIFSCTHSHSGIDTLGYWGKANALGIPSDGKDPEYMEMLYEKAEKVSLEAYRSKTEGRLYSGSKKLPGSLYTKRRIPDKHEVLYRIRFVPEKGNEIWLMNIGAHPNSLGGSNRKLSGEYPYFMREQIKKDTGADVVFGIGALGGMDAARLDEDDPLNCIKLQGAMFAEGAESIAREKQLSPSIKFIRQEFYLPVCNDVLTLLAMRGTMSFRAYPCQCSDTGIAMKTELTYMTVGSQKLVLLPGENFITTVYGNYEDRIHSPADKAPDVNPEPLAEIAGDKNLIAFGITNDMTGYVVPPNDFVLNPTQPYLNPTNDRFGERHYHETNSMGVGTQKCIAETFRKAVINFNK